MTEFLQVLELIFLTVPAPMAIGTLYFVARTDKEVKLNKKTVLLWWINGTVTLWSLFLLIFVPAILFKRSFEEASQVFSVTYLVFCVIAVYRMIINMKNYVDEVHWEKVKEPKPKKVSDFFYGIYWLGFFALLAIQIVGIITKSYEEGDDAFYVATANIAVDSDTMYRKLAYTGFYTELDARHGLAPFPMWIAYLSKITGLHVASLAHVYLPIILLVMAYAVFYLVGKLLTGYDREKNAIFMFIISLLVTFGGQSLFTAENFLLVRTAQGKAVLGNIIIPFTILTLFMIAEDVRDGKRVPIRIWAVLISSLAAGCLCSTMGALLLCLLVVISIGVSMIALKKFVEFIPFLAAMVIPAMITLLYILSD